MNAFRASLQCHVCMNKLKTPITLPCGRTMCKYHVSSPSADYYECISCQENHQVPPGGFPLSNLGSNMLKQGATQALYTDPSYDNALKAVEKLRERVENIQRQRTDKTDDNLSRIAELKRKIKRHYNEQAAKLLAAYRDASNALAIAEEKSRSKLDVIENGKRKEMDELSNRINAWERELQQFNVPSERHYRIALEAEGALIQLNSDMSSMIFEIDSILSQMSHQQIESFFNLKFAKTCDHLSNICHFHPPNKNSHPDIEKGPNLFTKIVNAKDDEDAEDAEMVRRKHFEDTEKMRRNARMMPPKASLDQESVDSTRHKIQHNNQANLEMDGIKTKRSVTLQRKSLH